MNKSQSVSPRTRNNWLVNAILFVGAALAMLTGVYFLIFTSGGFDGGRNPWYGVVILFTRHTWEDTHAWSGLAMLAAVIVHLIMHWSWIATMTRRVWNKARGEGAGWRGGRRSI
jgi:hypothetical protein